MGEAVATGYQVGPLDWEELIPDTAWAIYKPPLAAAAERGLPFAVGGGLAFSAYAAQLRNTKDLDLFVLPRDRQGVVDILEDAGFQDYFDQLPYDRSWIYRGVQDGSILDVIWQMVNRRARVEDDWLRRGPEVEIRGLRVRLLAPEELLWSKLYVVQRDRCDWPDLINILYRQGARLDWEHLLGKLEEDVLLLRSLLGLYCWICPDHARQLPDWLWQRCRMEPPPAGLDCDVDRNRVRLLDGRPWFGPLPGRNA